MATAQANYSLNIHPTEQLEKLHMDNLFKSINQVEQVATDFFSKVKNKVIHLIQMSQIQQRLDQLEGRIVKAEAVVEKAQGQALQIKSAPCFPLVNNQEYQPLIRDFINIQRQYYNYKFTENINQLQVEVSQITKQDLSDLIKIKNDMRGNKSFQTIPDFIQGHGKLQKQLECADSLLVFDTDIIPFKTKKEQQVGEEKVEYYDLTEQPKNANTNLVDAPQSLQEKNKETNVKSDMFQFKIKPKEFHLDMPDQINVPGFGNIQGLSAMDNIPDIKIEKQKQQVQEVQPPQVVETQVPTTLPKLDLKFDFEENEQTTTQEDKNDLSSQLLQKKKQQGQEKKTKKSKKSQKKKRKQSEAENEEREEGEEKENQSENSSNEEDEGEEDEEDEEEEEEKPKPKIPQKPNHMEALQNQIAKFQKKQQGEMSLEERIKLNKQTSQNKQIPDKIGTAKTLNFQKSAAKNQKKESIKKKKEESDSEQEEDSNTKDIQSLKIVSNDKTDESIQEEQKEEPIQTAKTANAPDMNSLLEQIRNPNNRKNLRPTKTVDKTTIKFQTKEQAPEKTEQNKKQKQAKEKQDPQKQTREMDFLRKQITQRFQTIKKSKESESDSD